MPRTSHLPVDAGTGSVRDTLRVVTRMTGTSRVRLGGTVRDPKPVLLSDLDPLVKEVRNNLNRWSFPVAYPPALSPRHGPRKTFFYEFQKPETQERLPKG